MPFFVGPGSSPDGGLEMKSDRVGMNTSTSTALSGLGTANGDAYLHTVGSGTTFMLYGPTGWFPFADGQTFPDPPSGVTATGGTKETGVSNPDGNTYTYHYFTTSGPFDVTAVSGPGVIEYLIVASGGAGGFSQNGDNRRGGGGGGAGGVITNFNGNPYAPNGPSITVSVQDYPLSVGGGQPAPGPGNVGQAPDSTAFGLTAKGGGGGGQNEGQNASDGGSGGGAGATANANSVEGDASPSNQGNAGGEGPANHGGGGGGAGSAGNTTQAGEGLRFFGTHAIPSSYGSTGPEPGRYFAGGGGGGDMSGGGSPGKAGGGRGGGQNAEGDDGTANTGSGGGGAGGGPNNTHGGQGASGIIIVRYTQ